MPRLYLLAASCQGYLLAASCQGYLLAASCQRYLLAASCQGYISLAASCQGYLLAASCQGSLLASSTSRCPWQLVSNWCLQQLVSNRCPWQRAPVGTSKCPRQPTANSCPLQLAASRCLWQLAGFPWSGKNVWKIILFPGQGKVREFWCQSGKFRKNEKSQKIQGISEFSKSCLFCSLLKSIISINCKMAYGLKHCFHNNLGLGRYVIN